MHCVHLPRLNEIFKTESSAAGLECPFEVVVVCNTRIPMSDDRQSDWYMLQRQIAPDGTVHGLTKRCLKTEKIDSD